MESAIEAEHASARKLFNSSLPWGLGSGDSTNAEHTRPPPGDRWCRYLVVFSRLRQEDETPCPSNSRGCCKCNHHRQHDTGPSQLPISTCRFPPHFRKGGEAMKGRRRTHGLLTAAHGVYDAAVTCLVDHITSHTFVSRLLEC